MKLYTEEQVKEIVEKSRETGLTAEYLILTTPPIELPSDEDAAIAALKIAETLENRLTAIQEAFYLAGFTTCNQWLKEQILNQNK